MVNYGVRTSVAAVFPLLKTNLGFTNVGLGAIGSFFLWSYALASPLAGHLGDRFDRGRVVLWSLVGWSAVTVACGLVHTRWELLTLRVLLGIIESLFLPAGMALVADYHPEKTRGTALGIMSVGQYVGLISSATPGRLSGGSLGLAAFVLGAGCCRTDNRGAVSISCCDGSTRGQRQSPPRLPLPTPSPGNPSSPRLCIWLRFRRFLSSPRPVLDRHRRLDIPQLASTLLQGGLFAFPRQRRIPGCDAGEYRRGGRAGDRRPRV